MDQYVSNIALASNLYEACASSNVRNIVHVSSIGVYDSETPLPWVESQDSFPESFYGISKLTVEKLGGWYNKKRGLRIKDLRVAQVMGVGERKGFMLSVFLEKAAKQEKLQLWGKGEGARDYIYVKDVALAIGQALQHADQSGVFNVGSGTRVKHRELAEAINETFDNAGNLETLEDHPEDLSIHQMDIERTRRILGWQPTWSLQDALLDIKMLIDSE
jgi:UDP-glucose 4-epimerase